MVALLAVLLLLVLASGPVALVLVLRLRARLGASRVPEAFSASQALRAPESAAPGPVPGPPWVAPPPRRDLEAVLGGAWLTWLGILAVFFGTAFFLSTDLQGSALAGTGQVLVAVLVAAVFLGAGRAFAARGQRGLQLGLWSGGIALLDLAAFAAHEFHHVVPSVVVLPFLFAIAFLGAVLAQRENAPAVAVLTLLGSLITPLLLRHEADPGRFLFPYLLAVTSGAAAVSMRRSWRVLPLVAFTGTVLVVMLWWDQNYSRDVRAVALAGTAALWAVFALQSLLGVSRAVAWSVVRGFIIVGNALAFEAVLYRTLAPEWSALRGLATAVLALAYALGARLASERGARREAVQMTRYAGVLLAAVAIPIQTGLAWVGFGWAMLALVLMWSGVQLPNRGDRAAALALLAASAVRIVFFDPLAALHSQAALRPVANGPFVLGACAAAAFAVAAILLRRRAGLLGTRERQWIDVLLVTAAALLWFRISVEVWASYSAHESAQARPGGLRRALLLTLSLVWALYGGLAIATGFLTRYRPLRVFGIVVLGCLVLKMFRFDLESLARGYRIASFAGVGVLLIAISVLYQRERRG